MRSVSVNDSMNESKYVSSLAAGVNDEYVSVT